MEWISENIEIIKVSVNFLASVFSGVIVAIFTISRFRLKYDKEIKNFENELSKRLYRVSKAYEIEIEAYREIAKTCSEISEAFSAIFPVTMSQHEIAWRKEDPNLAESKTELSLANRKLENTLKEYYPFVRIDETVIESIISKVDQFLVAINRYLDNDDNKTELRDEAYLCKEEYEKYRDALNRSMKNILSTDF